MFNDKRQEISNIDYELKVFSEKVKQRLPIEDLELKKKIDFLLDKRNSLTNLKK